MPGRELSALSRHGTRTLAQVAVLAAALASGCGRDHLCTGIGASPGVQIRGGIDGASIRVCVGPSCGSAAIVNGVGFIVLPTLKAGRGADLQTTYQSEDEQLTSRVRVVPVNFQPNGPGCEPIVARATLTFDKNGRVHAKPAASN